MYSRRCLKYCCAVMNTFHGSDEPRPTRKKIAYTACAARARCLLVLLAVMLQFGEQEKDIDCDTRLPGLKQEDRRGKL